MKNRTRITHLITSLEPSGAERVLYELATRLDRDRFDVSVACIRAGRGEVGEWLKTAGIPVHYLDVTSKFSPLKFAALFRLLKRERVEILHTHLFHADQAGRVAARLAGVPSVISTEHVVEKRRLPLRRVINAFTIPLTDKIICVSESVRKHIRRVHRIPGRKLRVIPNGIDLSRMQTNTPKEKARAEFDLPEKAKIVVSVGRLDYQKGYDLLLKAVEFVNKAGETVFCIAGDGPMRRELEETARKAGLAHSIRFPGRINDVPTLLAAADAYVQPSRWEGHPIALIEAMAAGLPIIATDVPGNRDAIRDGETGILVEPESPEELARGIENILNNSNLAEKLASAARACAETEYDAGLMARRYSGIYKKLAVSR